MPPRKKYTRQQIVEQAFEIAKKEGIEEITIRKVAEKLNSSAVKKIDISTPYTVKRYTSNWQGSYECFAPTPASLMKRMPKEIKGLDNFYMIGQWTEPGGGIPSAALDGRNVCKKICQKEKLNLKQDN